MGYYSDLDIAIAAVGHCREEMEKQKAMLEKAQIKYDKALRDYNEACDTVERLERGDDDSQIGRHQA